MRPNFRTFQYSSRDKIPIHHGARIDRKGRIDRKQAYKKLYLKSAFNFNISNISQQGYFTDTQSERLYKYIFYC